MCVCQHPHKHRRSASVMMAVTSLGDISAGRSNQVQLITCGLRFVMIIWDPHHLSPHHGPERHHAAQAVFQYAHVSLRKEGTPTGDTRDRQEQLLSWSQTVDKRGGGPQCTRRVCIRVPFLSEGPTFCYQHSPLVPGCWQRIVKLALFSFLRLHLSFPGCR